MGITGPIARGLSGGIVRRGGSAAPAPDSLLTDLVAWWSLDEPSGTRVNAHNPGTHDLTDNNTVGSAAGVVGDAASFVGASLEFLSQAACPLDLAQDWTIAGWFSQSSSAAVGWWGTGASSSFCRLATATANRVNLQIRGNDANFYTTTNITVTAGYASLVAVICTYTASTRTAVITTNDSQTQSVTLPEGVAPLAGTRFVVGAINPTPTSPMTGLADEVALAQRVWTAEEQTRFCAGMAYPG